MKAEGLLAHYARIADAPDAIARLRRFVLGLAVRGKLISQDPTDEDVTELVGRISEDRTVATQTGVLKEISKIPSEATLNFSVPKGWRVMPLPAVVYFQEGPGLRNWQFRPSGVPFLNIRTLQDGRVNRDLCQFLSQEEVDQKYQHFLVGAGDILCSTSGTIGKLAVATEADLPLMLNTSIVRFRAYGSNGPAQGFIKLFLATDLFLTQAAAHVTGAAQVNMGPSHLRKL